MSDYTKRLAAIETTLAAWDWYCDDDADPAKEPGVGQYQALRDVEEMAPGAASWLLAEHRAASEALTAAGIPGDGRSLAERVKALAGKAAPKHCGGTDAPHGHRFGCGLEPEDPDVLAAVERCRRGEHRKAGETMSGSCADCGVDWGDLDAEDEPSTGLGVAVEGDAEPLRTDGPIVRRTAAERVDEIDRRWGVDPESERRLDAFLAAAPSVSKMALRAPTTAAPVCLHESTVYGPNMPLRHGSARTKVCAACGAYKLVTWHDKDYSGWRSADVHADVVAAEAEEL